MTNFEKVGLFMKTFGQEVKKKSSFSTEKINTLRVSLINEELEEFKEAIKNNDLKEVADALTDILYVTYGAGSCVRHKFRQLFWWGTAIKYE